MQTRAAAAFVSARSLLDAKPAAETGGSSSVKRQRLAAAICEQVSLDFEVAGGRHHQGFQQALERLQSRGGANDEEVQLMREPSNAFDVNAIALHLPSFVRIGFCPRATAAVLSPLLDLEELVIERSTYRLGADAGCLEVHVAGHALSRSALAAIASCEAKPASEPSRSNPQPQEAAARIRPEDIPQKQPGSGLTVLSLFDGVAAARVALDKAQIPVSKYFTSEVHDASSRVVACRWSDSQPLGDIRSISSAHCAAICPDLVIGGSPCQDLSRAKRGGGDGIHGARSRLFFEYLRVLQECQLVNPDLVFVLENVIPAKEEDLDTITRSLGVPPLRLRAEEVSACNRDRYFWTNLPAFSLSEPLQQQQPDDLLESGRLLRTARGGKAFCIVAHADAFNIVEEDDGGQRLLKPVEEERLLGFPDHYTALQGLSDSERHTMLGNSFSVPVVTQLLSRLAPLAQPLFPVGQRLLSDPLRCNLLFSRSCRLQDVVVTLECRRGRAWVKCSSYALLHRPLWRFVPCMAHNGAAAAGRQLASAVKPPYAASAWRKRERSSCMGKERGNCVNGIESDLLSQSEDLAFWYASIRACARQSLDGIG